MTHLFVPGFNQPLVFDRCIKKQAEPSGPKPTKWWVDITEQEMVLNVLAKVLPQLFLCVLFIHWYVINCKNLKNGMLRLGVLPYQPI